VYCHALLLSGLLGLSGLLSPGIGHAGVLAVPDTPAARAIDLAPYWSVLDTPASASELDIAAVSRPALASAFRRVEVRNDALSLGLHEKPVWLKLQLRNDSVTDLERYLEIGFPHIDVLELYEAQDGGFRKIASGREGHFADRPFNHRHFVFPLVLSAGTQTTYYLRIHAADPLYLPARLWEPDHFFQHSQAEYMAHALYFGILLALG